MKVYPKIKGLIFAFCLISLSACGIGAAANPTVDTAPVYTQLASTALALQTQTALAKPTATDTPEGSPTPQTSLTPLITNTPLPGTPSVTPQATRAPNASEQASCDNMQYIADLTYQDGYVATPSEYMIKTWEVKNLGPCTWNTNYVLAFGWGGVGTDWNGIGTVNLTKDVLPGEIIDISVSLTAPKTNGEYAAVFRLQNDKGFNFGPTLTIDIVVQK